MFYSVGASIEHQTCCSDQNKRGWGGGGVLTGEGLWVQLLFYFHLLHCVFKKDRLDQEGETLGEPQWLCLGSQGQWGATYTEVSLLCDFPDCFGHFVQELIASLGQQVSQDPQQKCKRAKFGFCPPHFLSENQSSFLKYLTSPLHVCKSFCHFLPS